MLKLVSIPKQIRFAKIGDAVWELIQGGGNLKDEGITDYFEVFKFLTTPKQAQNASHIFANLICLGIVSFELLPQPDHVNIMDTIPETTGDPMLGSKLIIIALLIGFIACGEDFFDPQSKEVEKQLSVFQLFSGQKCVLYNEDQTKSLNINCETLTNFTDPNNEWCQKKDFQATHAKFPNKERIMKVCRDPFRHDFRQKEKIRFVALGDTGRGPNNPSKNFRQQQVSQAMFEICNAESTEDTFGCDFALIVGDLIYPTGTIDVWDRDFDIKFENIYENFGTMPFYLVPGNHDYRGNINSQFEYTYFSDRWIMPSDQFMIKNLPSWLNIQAINTNDLTTRTPTEFETQECSDQHWNILMGHHPSSSSGEYGTNRSIKDMLNKIYHHCAFAVYFGAHEHHLEHTQEDLFDSFVFGGGGTSLRSVTIKEKQEPDVSFAKGQSIKQMFAKSTHGFTLVEVTKEQMDIYIYDVNQWSYNDPASLYTETPDTQDYIYHCRKLGVNKPCLPVN